MTPGLALTSSRRVAGVAAEELRRAMAMMKAPGHPRPYFLSYLIRDEEAWTIQARYGAVGQDSRRRRRNAFCDVRVGSHRYDQVREGGLDDNDKEAESYSYVDLPFDGHLDGTRHGLWRLADARYREALETLLNKRSHALTYRDQNRGFQAFEKLEARRAEDWKTLPTIDHDFWLDYVTRVSRSLKRYGDIKDSHVEFSADLTARVFVDSVGSRIIESHPVVSLECYLWLLSKRGDAFPWTHKITVTDLEELPDEKAFRRQISKVVTQLRALAEAPLVRSFSGPAFLEPIPAGLLIHEAVGHRLEGCRLLASGEGQTFKGALGKKVLPSFLSVYDDPPRTHYDGCSLVGHYRYDDEGVVAARANLIEDGVLKDYLRTRVGLARGHRSNGHARCCYHERPISRMGVLCVEARDGLERKALWQRFLDEIVRSGAPYGLRVVHASSGETATDAYNFQAFMGEINLAARVYPDGRQEWIRGVNFVGTPLNATQGIVAAGRVGEVDNAWCGAESGYVPVSTVSPALVLSELELQAKPEQPYTPYTYEMPWVRGARR
ncbi:MAG: metallopeptidase TldD-related protein [Acidobacteriota bacterium]|nr:metallopeptidase TldD-related protein [Acidobacteriota bacterium]MDH3784919.1 metallopeptidase TldD-related protein [Acidobacteriota bacterium]